MTSSPGATPVVMGRELDALIAEKVMGWQQFPYIGGHADDSGIVQQWGATVVTIHYCPPGRIHVSTIERVPDYSTDIAAAWLVVEHTRKREWVWDIGSDGDTEWAVDVLMVGQIVGRASAPSVSASAETAPLAICRAALLAVGAA